MPGRPVSDETIRTLVDRTIEAAREYGEAQARLPQNREGDRLSASLGTFRQRERTLREALLIVLDAPDPGEEAPF